METRISEIEKAFSGTYEKCIELCQKISTHEAFDMTHGEVEKYIQIEGMDFLRQLFQDHLDLRSAREVKEKAVIGKDNILRKNIKVNQTRLLESVFGTVTVRRMGYGKKGYSSVYPMDLKLNLPIPKYSHGIQRIGAIEISRGSYGETLDSIERYTGGHLPKRQAVELMQNTVVDFDDFYSQPIFTQEMSESILVMTMDAKGIVMREEDLRESTRNAAKKRKNKLSKRLSRGEKKDYKRMATVASVYSISPHKRTPSMVAKECYPNNEKHKKPKPVGKRVWASVEKTVETIVDEMFSEALQQGAFPKSDI